MVAGVRIVCRVRRILLLITDLEIGGTPTIVRELAIRLTDPGRVQVEVACLSRWGPVADQIQAAGVRVTALEARGAADLSVIARLASLIDEREFDTVFSFLIHANAAAAAAALFCRRVRLIQSIQTTQPYPDWHWRLQRFVQRAADAVIVPSPSVAKIAVERANVSPGKMHVIPNAIAPDDFPHSDIALCESRPFPVGFIGRLDPVKRVPDLVAAAAELERSEPGLVHLHVFGDGPERGRIQSAIRRLRAESFVTLRGAVALPQEALAQLGLLVLPSLAEGFGLVLIEAMAAGVPVIGTDAPGIRDVTRDEQTGLLVQFGSITEMSEAIRRVVKDLPLRRKLIEAGLQEVRQRFSWDQVLPLYRQLLHL